MYKKTNPSVIYYLLFVFPVLAMYNCILTKYKIIHIMRFIIFYFLIFSTLAVFSQRKYTVNSNRAIKYYKQAGILYNQFQNNEALFNLSKAIKIENNFVEAYLFKADIHNKNKEYKQEAICYQRVESIDVNFFPNFYYNWALCLLKVGQYESAKQKLIILKTKFSLALLLSNKVEKQIRKCNFALESINNKLVYSPVNLGDGINTSADEYWPTISVRGDFMVFTRLAHKDVIGRNEDFYVAKYKNNKWQKANALEGYINTKSNEGAQTVTASGSLMYFTACGRADSYGSCDIYYSEKINGKWSQAKNVGNVINSSAWEAQASISADGSELFFVSNRKSGKGKMDIWSSKLISIKDDGSQEWSKPQNLNFNTSGDEMSPFIHASNRELYFSSDQIMGMGGQDIFTCSRIERNTWTEPKNLPYPINTYADEIGLIVSADGEKAYFSSDINSSMGKDLYSFDMPKELRLEKVLCYDFLILDSISRKPLKASLISVNINNRDTVFNTFSHAYDGRITVCNNSTDTLLYTILSKGYMMYSHKHVLATLSLKGEILLSPIKSGSSICLRNVFFDTDSYLLKKESYIELNNLFEFINLNDVKVEIGGHTDSNGSLERNMFLSEKRAQVVMHYLINRGINQHNLSYKAYASSKAIADNKTKKGRALNRRTEIIIL